MSLTQTFNAKVIYSMHKNPPILVLYSEELGYSQIDLGDLKLSESQIKAFDKAREVTGTYTLLEQPGEVSAPGKKLTDPWTSQKVTWKVTSITPKA